MQLKAGHSQGSITERYIHAAQVVFPGAAAKGEERILRKGAAISSEPLTREQLVHALAEVSHRTWIRQAVRDKGENEAGLSKDVHPHDLERAEDTVRELERLGVWPPR